MYIFHYIYIFKVGNHTNTTPEYLDNRLFFVDYGDLLVSHLTAFIRMYIYIYFLLFLYIYIYIYICIYICVYKYTPI